MDNLRQNKLTYQDQAILNQYLKEDLSIFEDQNYIFLTTHNRDADRLNQRRLAQLDTQAITFDAKIRGNFPETMYPIEAQIVLKQNAQVMFIKNDYTGKNRYFNGKIGIISDLGEDFIKISFEDGSLDVEAEIFTWENKKFIINPENGEIEAEIKGTFSQYPLRLAGLSQFIKVKA